MATASTRRSRWLHQLANFIVFESQHLHSVMWSSYGLVNEGCGKLNSFSQQKLAKDQHQQVKHKPLAYCNCTHAEAPPTREQEHALVTYFKHHPSCLIMLSARFSKCWGGSYEEVQKSAFSLICNIWNDYPKRAKTHTFFRCWPSGCKHCNVDHECRVILVQKNC